ncbi:MAG: hypothetical protein JWO92_7 [Chitinophagaceae bacterium]|nr:hypothetical protein [Chitinophagaceae bacterium]
MIFLIVTLIILLLAGFSTSKSDKPYSAEWGHSFAHLSIFNKGFSLAGGLSATTREQAYRNALIVGATGTGKTSAVLISSLYTLSRANSSIIILDVSSENYKLSSGYLSQKKKRKIYCLNFTETSDGFNIIQLCKSVDEIDKAAHVLIKNANVESKSDPFWSTSAQMATSLFMQYLFEYGQEDQKNMANVVLLLETYMAEPKKVDLLFVKAKNEKLMRSYKTLNAIPEKTRQSVLSTALAALRLFKSPAIARCTSINTFDIAAFRKEPSILYLCIPLNQINFLAPLCAVIFETLFQEFLSKIPSKTENDIFFLIDEMMTLKLDLGLVFSNCRKYRCGCMGLIQQEKMLEMKYSHGEAHAIKSNACCKVYLPGQNLITCKELEAILGKKIIKDEKGVERQINLMESAEIRTFNGAIILINNSLPLKRTIRPYYNHFIYNARTKIPPYVSDRKILFDEPYLIQFDKVCQEK